MFFALSKTVGLMLLPSNFLIGIGLAGLLLLLTRFAPLGRKLVVASIVLFAICAFSPLGNLLLYPLESRFPPWDATRGAPPDGIVVLGGSIDPERSVAHGVAVFKGSVDRLIAAAELAHRYPNARILFSGGNANLVSDDSAKEADYAIAVFEALGIAKARLTSERRSRNTLENAEFSKAIAAPKSGERWLLVTSAYHMPRSIGIFRKVGFAVEPYPVDWLTGNRADLMTFSVVAIEGLTRVETGMREWMGLAAYWISGRTDEFFPGPDRQ
ncbi:MAG TPA: YdcF family protein [Bradyrhizobium sp.]|nr:YdcF family protein [Bradyrhizobium sp.]